MRLQNVKILKKKKNVKKRQKNDLKSATKKHRNCPKERKLQKLRQKLVDVHMDTCLENVFFDAIAIVAKRERNFLQSLEPQKNSKKTFILKKVLF